MGVRQHEGLVQVAIGLVAAAALVAVVVVLARGFGTAEAPAGSEELGNVVMTEQADGQIQLTVVGVASSGFFACDRLVVSSRPEGDEYVVAMQRSAFATGCNDDALPRVVHIRVPAQDFAGIASITVMQDGVLVGSKPYPPR